MNCACALRRSLKRFRTPIAVLLVFGALNPLDAQEVDRSDVIELPLFLVEAEAEKDHYIQGPFLPDTQGARINVGKKTTVLDFDGLPRITGNNYRQALSQAPGLILSEETSPLISIGYRGLTPHRAQFTQVLKDGIPIHADQFGYPEAYYTPPLDTVDRIEFTRGGAALMYGPQPGGALNYVTHRPRTDTQLGGSTLHTFGSDGYYSSFSYLDGTSGPLGYYGYYNHRESDGIRSANSDYRLDAFTGRLAVGSDTSSRWIFTAETYEEEHGEPGGLTFASGGLAVNYDTQRETPSRLFDRFNLDRTAFSLVWERDFSRGTFVGRLWTIDYTRASRRQGGGGFGTLPTGASANTNTIENQQFEQFGAEARVRVDWGAANAHVFTAGAQLYRSKSPRTDSRGNSADATTGTVRIQSEREIFYTPVFAENLFRFGALSITPGARLEFVDQEVRELVNVTRTDTPLQNRDERVSVPLFGIGVAYDLPAQKAQLYANASESYRPMIFTEAVPNGATTVVDGDLEEGRAIQYELGYRAEPASGLVLDASVFYLEFDNQIGSTTLSNGSTFVANIGRAVHKGIEIGASYDLLARRASQTAGTPAASLSVYANALLLDAEFKEGAAIGKTPQYAPDHVVRTGVIYTRGEGLKLALTGTLSADSYANDDNTAQRYVPAYAVWDLTAEWRVPNTMVRLIGGVNNVFDQDYYSRVRPDGIDPAPLRNFYVGAALEF
ncbi:MAG TPA: TonB-dependent receptor [Opitutaceae bacterium]|nr:TonB-dependent receptor [Opitutaceae bacterium]